MILPRPPDPFEPTEESDDPFDLVYSIGYGLGAIPRWLGDLFEQATGVRRRWLLPLAFLGLDTFAGGYLYGVFGLGLIAVFLLLFREGEALRSPKAPYWVLRFGGIFVWGFIVPVFALSWFELPIQIKIIAARLTIALTMKMAAFNDVYPAPAGVRSP